MSHRLPAPLQLRQIPPSLFSSESLIFSLHKALWTRNWWPLTSRILKEKDLYFPYMKFPVEKKVYIFLTWSFLVENWWPLRDWKVLSFWMRPSLVVLVSRCFSQNKTTFLSNNSTKSFLKQHCTTAASFIKMPAHKLLVNTAEPPIGKISIRFP